MRQLAPLALPLSLVALAAGCGGGDEPEAGGGGGTAIGMQNLQFVPRDATVTVGQEVTWRNDESIPHNVVATAGADFRSETFGKDGTFRFTPQKAGTIRYVCTIHPGMAGTLKVTQ